MKNMGLGELALVAPRTPVGRIGERMAAHARDVLARRRVFADLDAALGDCHLVVGTVGRTTTGPDEPVAPRAAAPDILAAAQRGRVALVFGPEDHGLSNAELGRCQIQVRIPAAPAYPSLNLAQAVLVVSYELRAAARARGDDLTSSPSTAGSPPELAAAGRDRSRLRGAEPRDDFRPATSREREALIVHLTQALDRIGFLSRQNPDHILRDVRSLLGRAGLTARDVRIWRGIARQVLWMAARSSRARPRRTTPGER